MEATVPKVLPADCADCARPATVSLGTVALCQWCKWAAQTAIFTRRPDLRAPTGIGIPTGGSYYDDGPPLLRCDQCKAGWGGTPFDDCPWCVERQTWLAEEQVRMERARFRDLHGRVRDGDMEAIAPAIHLANRLGLQDALARAIAAMPP